MATLSKQSNCSGKTTFVSIELFLVQLWLRLACRLLSTGLATRAPRESNMRELERGGDFYPCRCADLLLTHTTNFPIGKSCTLHMKRSLLRVSLGQPCVRECVYASVCVCVNVFTKKRNYIGRLHFDTFGCLTPHTTDRACFRLAEQRSKPSLKL